MASVLEEVQQADRDYIMPECRVGMCVSYFPADRLNGGKPDLGYIAAVHNSNRRITVYVPNVGIKDGVRHITDPKLKMSPSYREDGAWDYTEDYLRQEYRMASLESEVESLKQQLEQRTRKAKEQV